MEFYLLLLSLSNSLSSSLDMDWMRQDLLNIGSAGDEDGVDEDHLDDEELDPKEFSSSRLARICLLDKTGFGCLL